MKEHLDSKKLTMIGLIQEQHADRCRLFQQWKKLDFPIVQDALNQTAIAVVPVLILIDEHGIVRSKRPNPRTIESEFINKKFSAPSKRPTIIPDRVTEHGYWEKRLHSTDDSNVDIDNLVGLADALVTWKSDESKTKKAIDLYEQAIKLDAKSGDLRFRLGVANRKLYELSGQNNANLFFTAVKNWESALSLNPNQYIWNRRIQQYGPRLKKPYSFYDWVEVARKDIIARGEKPHPLVVEPNGAELAARSRKLVAERDSKNPDPRNEVFPVEKGVVVEHINFVPTQPKPGDVVAVHVGLSISAEANWNHEGEPASIGLTKLLTLKCHDNSFETKRLIQKRNPINRSHFHSRSRFRITFRRLLSCRRLHFSTCAKRWIINAFFVAKTSKSKFLSRKNERVHFGCPRSDDWLMS